MFLVIQENVCLNFYLMIPGTSLYLRRYLSKLGIGMFGVERMPNEPHREKTGFLLIVTKTKAQISVAVTLQV